MTIKNQKLSDIIFAIFVFLIPLFFLPLTVDFYDFNKNYLLWVGVIVGFFLWAIKSLLRQKLEIKTSPFLLPLFLWLLANILATIFVSPNKVEVLLLPGGLGTLAGLFLFYLLLLNLVENRQRLFGALVASAGVLSLITIYQFFGLGEVLIPSQSLLAFARGKTWTPAGNLLAVACFDFLLLPPLFLLLKRSLKTWPLKAGIYGLLSLLLLTGGSLAVYQILPGKPAALTLLPYQTSWAIAAESFKQNPLLGVGLVNFISAFNRFRPLSFNRFNFWNLRFGTSSSFIFQLWTETGLLGILTFGLVLITLGKYIKRSKSILDFAGVLATILVLIFLPQNFTILFAFFVLLAFAVPPSPRASLNLRGNFRWLPIATVVLVFTPSAYFAGRAYLAEIYFQKSLNAIAKNNGIETYNNQIKAIQLNPYRIDFRLAHCQINLALANSLATNPPSGQLTDQDRNNIIQLVQQAIREGKTAALLNPSNAIVWENLAQLYRQLLNFAQGADQWAITAYQQAIATDPINPRLRIDLGGLFYALGNYDEAQKIFRVAVELKPDYANGWYNLAAAYREDKKYPQAYQAMQQTLFLVPADSTDWQKAKEELDEIAKKLPSPTPSPTVTQEEEKETLTPPQTLPSPVIKPPIELPKEEAVPSPSP